MFRLVLPYLARLLLLAVAAGLAGPASAQSDTPAAGGDPQSGATVTNSPAQPTDEIDPLKRQPNEKQRKQQKASLKVELTKVYKKWLNEDVVWIITDQERAAFKQLSNDEERDNFIEAFWQRRDPTPDTEENEYKEEHYRRIAYTNEHFAAGIPGWKTDRGRIYIMYGAADEVESHPSGGTYQRPMDEGGGETSTFPFEQWRYRYLEGIGQEVIIEFVDSCMCGDYHMSLDRSEKDALKYTPNAGLTQYEQMGMATKASRFSGGGLEQLGTGTGSANNATKQFDRLERYAKLQAPPPVKDVNGDRKGVWSRGIQVPEYSDDRLSTSTLIVADVMEPVPTKDVSTGSFVIGLNKVRPRVAPADGKPALFKRTRDQKVNFWIQVYNLGVDGKTHKPSATFEYAIVNVATNKSVGQKTESTETIGNVVEQVTLQKSIASANLQPGVYRIDIKVNDNISKQTIDPSATFAVE